MKTNENVTDFVIRYKGHPKYNSTKIIENDAVEVIVQKLEMLLFTNKKDIIGTASYDFGADLEYLLWETKLPNNILEKRIKEQINKYIPELVSIGYDFILSIYEGDFRDIMSLDFTIYGYNITFVLD
ncbi:hypothetical protein M0Q50_02925 [bacterium]|jgi:hypothetical protein|nr:hypothetical protein [bacterium]